MVCSAPLAYQDSIMEGSHLVFSCGVNGAAALKEVTHEMAKLIFSFSPALDDIQQLDFLGASLSQLQ